VLIEPAADAAAAAKPGTAPAQAKPKTPAKPPGVRR